MKKRNIKSTVKNTKASLASSQPVNESTIHAERDEGPLDLSTRKRDSSESLNLYDTFITPYIKPEEGKRRNPTILAIGLPDEESESNAPVIRSILKLFHDKVKEKREIEEQGERQTKEKGNRDPILMTIDTWQNLYNMKTFVDRYDALCNSGNHDNETTRFNNIKKRSTMFILNSPYISGFKDKEACDITNEWFKDKLNLRKSILQTPKLSEVKNLQEMIFGSLSRSLRNKKHHTKFFFN